MFFLRHAVSVLAAAALILVLSSCGGASAPASASSFAGTAEGYAGPSAQLRLDPALAGYGAVADSALLSPGTPLAPQQNSALVGEGEIAADGSFSFAFVDVPPRELLYTLGIEGFCSEGEIEVSAPDALSYSEGLANIRVVDDGAVIGTLVKTEFSGGTIPAQGSGRAVLRIYLDRALSVRGTCTAYGDVWTYDLDLDAGWSILNVVVEEDPNTRVRTFRYGEGDIAAVPWKVF